MADHIVPRTPNVDKIGLSTAKYAEVNAVVVNIDGTAAAKITRAVDAFGLPSDITTGDATSLAHGFMPKASFIKLAALPDASTLTASLAGKANTVHTHDDRYFTEGEVTDLLAGKSDTGHNHNDIYYTDSEVDALFEALPEGFTNPMTAQGDLIVGGTGGSPEGLAIGVGGQYLSSGAGTTPVWETFPTIPGAPEWGNITGTLSDQTDLQAQLDTKLNLLDNLSDLASASAARTNLGLVIGTNVQAYAANLTTWASLTPGAIGAIGGTTPGSGAFTTLTTSGSIVSTGLISSNSTVTSFSGSDYSRLNGQSIITYSNAVGQMFGVGESIIASGTAVQVGALGSFSWRSTNRVDTGSVDVALWRAGTGHAGLRNATSAQTFSVANTWTSATSYERLELAWAANVACIDTTKGSGGGTLRGLKIGGATTSLLGFWGATPVVQQVLATGGGATVDNVITLLQTLGLCKQS